jgi:hypothetical protein
MRSSLFVLALFVIGCSQQPAPPSTSASATSASVTDADEAGHAHDRDHRKTLHLGKYHADLTAHISAKDGNELDIFVETVDAEPKPVALTAVKILGKATREGDDKEYDLTFEPAPASERPKDEKPGTCSHYVAKAPFMKPDDTLTVTISVELDGRVRKCSWKNFEVKKFTHHVE